MQNIKASTVFFSWSEAFSTKIHDTRDQSKIEVIHWHTHANGRVICPLLSHPAFSPKVLASAFSKKEATCEFVGNRQDIARIPNINVLTMGEATTEVGPSVQENNTDMEQ